MGFKRLRDVLIDEHGWCPKVATLAARYYLDVENFSESVRWCLPRPISRGFNADPMLSTTQWLQIVRHPYAGDKGKELSENKTADCPLTDRIVFSPVMTNYQAS